MKIKRINNYMAILRNLRNIIEAGVDEEHFNKVCMAICDKQAVKHSKLLPFRFFSAYREVQDLPNCTNKVLDVLETAIEYSVENLPKLKGKTVIAIDTSGSMGSRISQKSTVLCCDIAMLLAIISSKICEEYIIYTFDEKLGKVTVTSHSGIIQTALNIPVNGGGTNLSLPLIEMVTKNIKADRLIMLSDNELNCGYVNGTWCYRCATPQALADKYRNTINKDLWVHAIDLQGYGTQQFIGGKTNIIAGWSEKVLEFISLAEQGIETQVKRIENYK